MDERLVLTKQDISRDLLRAHKQMYRLATLLCVIFSASLAFYISFVTSALMGKIAIYSVFALTSALMVWLYARELYIYKNCRFSVEEDTVVAVEHDKYNFFTIHPKNPIQEKITFKNAGTVWFCKKDVGHCSVNDVFYLVKFKKRVIHIYSARSYSYNE